MENGLVLCAVDRTETGTKVLDAAKATGAPVLMAHVANSLLDSTIPAFVADPETERVVAHGPTGPGLLELARKRKASLIVLGTRGKRWPSVARYVTKRAPCPVLVIGPAADPEAEPVTRSSFDRGLLRRAAQPVLIAPSG
ncbi:universal stress protein [Solirubrobacter phytolaccae]|uniref:Universal stress protein n=1 Tax=Solirubrobacter phytolaccae TaxID=1404360 RepID=A0A9X3S892_9ACTN|nr:universal stress protein [Solirubrobacter phytolaccae]MDA0181894.1 universal stress protein [Solirubrobacter phytolaccae]